MSPGSPRIRRSGSIRPIGLIGLLAIMLALQACLTGRGETVLSKRTLEKDTVWSGNVIVKGDVYVPSGVTLTVLPGTTVRFERIDEKSHENMFGTDSPWYPQAEIIVRGRIVAQGTEEKKIVFTSNARDGRPADWGAINLLGSHESIIEHCKIFCAYNGVHGHSATAVITHNEFARNGVAISFKREDGPDFSGESRMIITDNEIHHNKGGINVRTSSAVIARNEIRENSFFGIWVKEEADVQILRNNIVGNDKGVYLYDARPTPIHFNNIQDNSEYNVAMAEAQAAPIDATGNYWGGVNPEKIAGTIFDRAEDPEVAEVFFTPFSKRPVEGAGMR